MSDEPARFWIIDNPLPNEPCLPEPASCRDGAGPFLYPIVDEVYGGVIAWGNTYDQAERIVASLVLSEEVLSDPDYNGPDEIDHAFVAKIAKQDADDGILAPRRCERCNLAIDEYAAGETLCGACEDEQPIPKGP